MLSSSSSLFASLFAIVEDEVPLSISVWDISESITFHHYLGTIVGL